MAKSTKHQDKIGSFDTFRAPWETESGAEVDVDKATLKRLLFNLKVGEAKAQDAQDDAREALAAAETERDEAKDQAANANPAEAQKQIDKLTAKVEELTTERDKLVSDAEHAKLRAEVLGDLDPKYAKYVQGETKEELEESLASVKEDFGLSEESGEDDDDEEVDEVPARLTPVSRIKNPADRKSGQPGDVPVDFDKVADQILGRGPFG